MSRQLLKEYIKKAVREKLEHQKKLESNRERSVYLIYKFPGLKKVFVDIMSPAFPRFLTGVEIISPKPTTFKVHLINGMEFNVYYANRGKYILKISGRKYFTDNLNDVERASQAITDLLELNYNTEELSAGKSGENAQTNDLKAALGSSGGGSSLGSSSGGEMGVPTSQAPAAAVGSGVDPDAPADSTIPGQTAEPLPGEEPENGEEEEEPKT